MRIYTSDKCWVEVKKIDHQFLTIICGRLPFDRIMSDDEWDGDGLCPRQLCKWQQEVYNIIYDMSTDQIDSVIGILRNILVDRNYDGDGDSDKEVEIRKIVTDMSDDQIEDTIQMIRESLLEREGNDDN